MKLRYALKKFVQLRLPPTLTFSHFIYSRYVIDSFVSLLFKKRCRVINKIRRNSLAVSATARHGEIGVVSKMFCCFVNMVHQQSDKMDKKKELKQKVLLFYDQLFAKVCHKYFYWFVGCLETLECKPSYMLSFQGEDPINSNPTFWDEFFLLWANQGKLEECVGRLSGQQLLRLKPLFNLLTSRCITVAQEEQNIKAVNAIQVHL